MIVCYCGLRLFGVFTCNCASTTNYTYVIIVLFTHRYTITFTCAPTSALVRLMSTCNYTLAYPLRTRIRLLIVYICHRVLCMHTQLCLNMCVIHTLTVCARKSTSKATYTYAEYYDLQIVSFICVYCCLYLYLCQYPNAYYMSTDSNTFLIHILLLFSFLCSYACKYQGTYTNTYTPVCNSYA